MFNFNDPEKMNGNSQIENYYSMGIPIFNISFNIRIAVRVASLQSITLYIYIQIEKSPGKYTGTSANPETETVRYIIYHTILMRDQLITRRHVSTRTRSADDTTT